MENMHHILYNEHIGCHSVQNIGALMEETDKNAQCTGRIRGGCKV